MNNFTCHCYKGFTGRHCEVDVDECLSSPCLNEGQCYQKSHEHLFNQSFRDLNYDLDIPSDSLGYACICPAGFEGKSSSPCLLFTLSIASFPIGIHCETNKNDCNLHSCQNGGTCIDGINSYTCTCLPGFEGKTCQYLTDPCYLSPCRNGATCKSPNQTPRHSYM